MTEPLYVAQVVKDDTGEVVRQSEPAPERRTEQIADGLSGNLNWDRYHVKVIPAPPLDYRSPRD